MTDLVPVIDLNAPDAVNQIDQACRSVGFLSIVGHRVPQDVTQRMVAATAGFFALPLDGKLGLRPPNPAVNRGYTAKGSEGLIYSLGVEGTPPDLFEAFNIGPDSWPAGDPVYEAERERIFAANIWPDHPTDLRPALVDYFDEMRRLAHRLTRLFALALGLEPDFFDDKTDHSTDTLRVLNYERAAGEPEPVEGQQRMGAHTDYGIVTVLHADPVPGLQILSSEGQWTDVIPAAGSFVVNLGDLLAEWTNDRWRSTLHRVVPPLPSTEGPVRRRSVAFFHDGNYDSLIECLPTCQSPTNPPRYPPVRAGDHLLGKLLGPRTLKPSDAVSTVGDRTVG